ncbi:MAG: hypothetical protein ACYC69_02030 [Thermodesulfovibrionales bacterium]
MRQRMKYFVAGPLALSIFFAYLFFAPPAFAEPDVKEGYDENTEITVRGSIAAMARGATGPVILRLAAAGRTYEVITAPPWYLEQENISFSPGLELEVTGSKYFGNDGSLYMISGRIKFVLTGKEHRLRDSDYRPLWGRGRNRNR